MISNEITLLLVNDLFIVVHALIADLKYLYRHGLCCYYPFNVVIYDNKGQMAVNNTS